MMGQMTQGLGQQFNQQAQIPGLLGQVLGQTRPTTVGGFPPANQTGGAGGAGGAGGGGFLPDATTANQQAQNYWNSNPYLGGSFTSQGNQAGAGGGGLLDQPLDLGGSFDYNAYNNLFLPQYSSPQQPQQSTLSYGPLQDTAMDYSGFAGEY